MLSLQAEQLDPIEEIDGYLVKRGDSFRLGPHVGSKVRQCLHVVGGQLDKISNQHNNGICTGAGLPSPQTAIVAGVAKHFGLRCAVTTPWFLDGLRDVNRINASLAQREGAAVYGVGNPNPNGYLRDVNELVAETGFMPVRFGMCGDRAMEPIAKQVENVPDSVRQIVVISGSGLTAIGILRGLAQHGKPVERVYVCTLSGHYALNKKRWHDSLPSQMQYTGEVVEVASPKPYRHLMKHAWLDWTYEAKAWAWMTDNLPPSTSTLFWVIGTRCYDTSVIEPIRWHFTRHEQKLRAARQRKRNTSTGSVLSPPR